MVSSRLLLTSFIFRVYENINGNCVKKNKDFKMMIEDTFGHKKLVDLIQLVHENEVSTANAKQIMMMIIDGDLRNPAKIAAELGMVGKVTTDIELQNEAKKCVAEQKNLVKKILRTGKQGPVMHLVGIVMRVTNGKGDPVMIKHLLQEEIKKVKLTQQEMDETDDDDK